MKITIEKSKKILEQNGDKYSTEEIKLIIDFLYKIGTIEQEEYKRKKRDKNENSNLH